MLSRTQHCQLFYWFVEKSHFSKHDLVEATASWINSSLYLKCFYSCNHGVENVTLHLICHLLICLETFLVTNRNRP